MPRNTHKGVTTSFHHGTKTDSIEPYFGTFESPNNFFGITTENAVFAPIGFLLGGRIGRTDPERGPIHQYPNPAQRPTR